MDGPLDARRFLGILGAVTGTILLIAAGAGAFENPVALMVSSLAGVSLMTVGGLMLAKSYLDL